jgi:hypothetical protein
LISDLHDLILLCRSTESKCFDFSERLFATRRSSADSGARGGNGIADLIALDLEPGLDAAPR